MVFWILLVAIGVAWAFPSRAASFRDEQLTYDRVQVARDETLRTTRQMFADAEVPFPPAGIFLRVFKEEMQLELWVQPQAGDAYRRLKVYDVCSSSGELGPKRQQGDLQIPEGFYRINHFNPFSTFYLSMGINYPNRSDRILGARNPGGSIYIHGDCVTIGCVPITDPQIKELYWIAVETRNGGQDPIPVHIFPFRMTEERMHRAESARGADDDVVRFWRNIKNGYDLFEESNRIPRVRIDRQGRYRFTAR